MRNCLSLLLLILILQNVNAQNHVCNESFETARDVSFPVNWRVQFSNVSPSLDDWLKRVNDPANIETCDGEFGLKISPNGIGQPAGSRDNCILFRVMKSYQ
jgi:hypothetical protein